MTGVEVMTFGCRLNLAEGETIRRAAADAGDLLVVNSCAVTGEAVRQAEKAVRRAHREQPDRRIVVTGCAAQLEPARFAEMAGVASVLDNDEKLVAENYTPSPRRRPGPISLSTIADPVDEDGDRPQPSLGRRHVLHSAATFAGRSRAFVQVQTGCDHRCTFCIIPFARGDSRSVAPELVTARIEELVAEGAREVVLTGVDLTGYGADLPDRPMLGDLAARILRDVPALPRLRLSSVDAVEIDPVLFELLAGEQRMMPHLHLSLQSGDDMILKRMRRRHDRAAAIRLVAALKARRPEIAIGADLIAGFPTEDEAMAANSLALIEDCDIVMAHIFPYSPRPGTPAARMPQVEPEVARERAGRLRAAAEARRGAWLAGMVGSVQRVLIERGGTGHAENFAKVRPLLPDRHPSESRDLPLRERSGSVPRDPSFRWDDVFGGDDKVGEVVNLKITAVAGDTLVGLPA